MIILDTNVISEIMRPEPNPAVLDWLDAQYRDELFISAIVKAEIEMGIAILDDGKRKQALFKAAEFIFINFANRCLSFDEKTASHYAAIIAFSKKQGRPISVEDALIAATALQYSTPLATRNVTDFDFLMNLKLINPWEYPL
jgi:hypothetical protein